MCHGRPARATAARMPSARRAPRRWVCAYASGVRISSIVALAAASESGLPKSVPPMATETMAIDREFQQPTISIDNMDLPSGLKQSASLRHSEYGAGEERSDALSVF